MQQKPEPISTLLYRVEAVEKDIGQLKSQLNMYEPIRENDLKLSRINDIVSRIESELQKVKERLETINARMIASDQESQKRDIEARDSQAKLQIRTLWYIVSTVITILTALLIGYLTHLIH
jgi:phage shock protein A